MPKRTKALLMSLHDTADLSEGNKASEISNAAEAISRPSCISAVYADGCCWLLDGAVSIMVLLSSVVDSVVVLIVNWAADA